MSYPKWKYRKHPDMGFFQSTFVLTAEAEAELEADWSDDPASTGFAVRPATQINTAHIAVGLQLHEPVDSGAGPAASATVAITTSGDTQNV